MCHLMLLTTFDFSPSYLLFQSVRLEKNIVNTSYLLFKTVNIKKYNWHNI